MIHQLCQLGVVEEGGRSAAEVELVHHAVTVKQAALHLHLAQEVLEIHRPMLGVAGDFLGAAAVVAERMAKRQMHVQGQRPGYQLGIAGRRDHFIGHRVETLMELHGSGVRRVART